MLKGEQQAAVPEDIIMDGMHREEQRAAVWEDISKVW